MKIVAVIARILLGFLFTVFGLNGFFMFMKGEIHASPDGKAFVGAMFGSHFLYLPAGVEAVCGILLLTNQYVPVALVMLGAVIANILAFHVAMAPDSLVPLPVLVTALWFIAAWPLKTHFAKLFVRKVEAS